MRVLTGELKGRTLAFREAPGLRPTADKTRKAIFDALQGALEGRNVLDLYSGTGALGIEALSCGAAKVRFVESSKAQAAKISKNLFLLGLERRSEVFAMDALKSLSRFESNGERFDVVFLDPPYGQRLGLKTFELLGYSAVLNEGALVVFECEKSEKMPAQIGDLRLLKEKTYGDTKVLFFKNV